jgi:hypothetical protein
MDLLPNALAAHGQTTLSPFSDCVILLTLWGQFTIYSTQSQPETMFLDAVLEKRRGRLAQCAPAASGLADPMMIFTSMLANAASIDLIDTVKTKTRPTPTVVGAYEQRAVEAAREIVLLAKAAAQLSCFKASIKSLLAGSRSAGRLTVRCHVNMVLGSPISA